MTKWDIPWQEFKGQCYTTTNQKYNKEHRVMNESQYQFPYDNICHTVCVFHILICNLGLNLMLVFYDLLHTLDTLFETDEMNLSCHD